MVKKKDINVTLYDELTLELKRNFPKARTHREFLRLINSLI